MKRIVGLLLLAGMLFAGAPAVAQTPATIKLCIPTSGAVCPLVTATNPLPVSATVTVGGFAPNGSYASLTATASTSASTALPTGATVRISNLGSTATVSCTFATGAAVGLVNNLTIAPQSSVSRVVGAYDHIACIDQTGSTGSNLVIIEGGSGLGNDSGGGGGGTGGASSSFAAAFPSTGTAVGFTDGTNMVAARVRNPGSSAVIGDAAIVVTDPNAIAAINSPPPLNVNTVNTPWTGLTPGASASPQTGAIVAANTDQSSVAGVALGVPTNFGITPTAVKVPGVNASLFMGTVAVSAAAPLAVTATNGAADPCQSNAATIKSFSITTATTTNIVTGTSAKKLYVCYLYMQTAAANNVAVISGTTGATCGANTAGLVGGTTAANGLNNAANGGQAMGNGGYSVLQVQTNNDDICIITSAATPLAGVIKTVVQ